MPNEKYYKILGLSKNSNPSNNDIKKAYKKSALKWHPDRCKDDSKKFEFENRFKDIGKAYEILSDPKKKELYDKFGEAAINKNISNNGFRPGFANGFRNGKTTFIFRSNSGGGSFSDPFNLFDNVFSSKEFKTNIQFRKSSNSFSKTNKIYNLYCTLNELCNGAEKKFKIDFNKLNSKIIKIKIKPGWKEGTKIKYTFGNTLITFIIKQKKHPYFIRINDDIMWNCILTKTQADNGVKLTIPTLTKNKDDIIMFTKNEFIYNNKKKIIPNEGIPIKNTDKRGNLIINFIIND